MLGSNINGANCYTEADELRNIWINLKFADEREDYLEFNSLVDKINSLICYASSVRVRETLHHIIHTSSRGAFRNFRIYPTSELGKNNGAYIMYIANSINSKPNSELVDKPTIDIVGYYYNKYLMNKNGSN